MRNKIKETDKRVRLVITISPKIKKMIEDISNKSKYIEDLIMIDLIKQDKYK